MTSNDELGSLVEELGKLREPLYTVIKGSVYFPTEAKKTMIQGYEKLYLEVRDGWRRSIGYLPLTQKEEEIQRERARRIAANMFPRFISQTGYPPRSD